MAFTGFSRVGKNNPLIAKDEGNIKYSASTNTVPHTISHSHCEPLLQRHQVTPNHSYHLPMQSKFWFYLEIWSLP